MKSLFACCVCVLLALASQAQRFGFVAFQTCPNGYVIFSPVKDLSTLDCTTASKQYDDGTPKSQADIYKECIWVNWFKVYLEEKGLLKLTDWAVVPTVRVDNTATNRMNGSDASGFMTKELALQYRDDAIYNLKRMGLPYKVFDK